ncbi:MAG: PDZ domain-containing protein [Acetobacteraceae bacterium]|nr:PDZ domain-containing protein [Acetobacteraceae bacterium]
MRLRLATAAVLLALSLAPAARADNAMGYQLVTEAQAQSLPRNRGSLGMDVAVAQQISDAGMTFDLIRVTGVHRGSAAAQAGFRQGDQIVAVDGRVFSSIRAFAGYVGSLPPGTRMTVDLVPAGGGPQQAQRLTAVVGNGAQGGAAQGGGGGGMSTGAKIGLGVAALLGCYELGCFNRH